MADPSLLATFPTPTSAGDAPFVIEHVTEEFTSLCPMTGHPDFATVTVRYCPCPASRGGVCVELKSLKLYYQSHRNDGIFYEDVTNVIRNDLAKAMNPVWMRVVTSWRGRGGVRSVIVCDHGDVPAHERAGA